MLNNTTLLMMFINEGGGAGNIAQIACAGDTACYITKT